MYSIYYILYIKLYVCAQCTCRYGGKVTGNVSKKTSYLVLGEDAGQSKLGKVSLSVYPVTT